MGWGWGGGLTLAKIEAYWLRRFSKEARLALVPVTVTLVLMPRPEAAGGGAAGGGVGGALSRLTATLGVGATSVPLSVTATVPPSVARKGVVMFSDTEVIWWEGWGMGMGQNWGRVQGQGNISASQLGWAIFEEGLGMLELSPLSPW